MKVVVTYMNNFSSEIEVPNMFEAYMTANLVSTSSGMVKSIHIESDDSIRKVWGHDWDWASVIAGLKMPE
jgi:hypothetical protein